MLGSETVSNLNISLAADVRGQLWERYDAFNEIGAGASLDLRHRFGLGRQAPWISLEERAGYDRFHESARSSWDESLRLRGGITISERIALEAGYRFQNLAAPDDFFDQAGHSGNARVTVDLTSCGLPETSPDRYYNSSNGPAESRRAIMSIAPS